MDFKSLSLRYFWDLGEKKKEKKKSALFGGHNESLCLDIYYFRSSVELWSLGRSAEPLYRRIKLIYGTKYHCSQCPIII